MDITELIIELQKIQKKDPTLPVWLGIDGGEGWEKQTEVFLINARHCPLDGDDCGDETFYPDCSGGKERDPSVYTEQHPTQYLRMIDYEKNEMEIITDDEAPYCRDILVLGNYGTQSYIEQTLGQEIEDKKDIEKFLKEQEKQKELDKDPDYQQYLELQKKFNK
jgi:hypothetical protein